MEQKHFIENTFDLTVYDLCQKVDYWKERALHFEEAYKQELLTNSEYLNERMAESQKGVANALLFALSVKEGENGELIIDAEDRKTMAENYR